MVRVNGTCPARPQRLGGSGGPVRTVVGAAGSSPKVELAIPAEAARRRRLSGKEAGVLAEAQDNEDIILRVAALDVVKAELVCCVRVPRQGRKRLQPSG